MAKTKRTAQQREADLDFVASLYLKGKSQREIVEELAKARDYSISQPQVSLDTKKLIERWQKSALANIDEAKRMELARIDNLERTYWEAWDHSLETKEVQRTERTEGAHVNMKASVQKITTGGDPRFLNGVQWCIEQRIKILGLNTTTLAEDEDGNVKAQGAQVIVYVPENGRLQDHLNTVGDSQ